MTEIKTAQQREDASCESLMPVRTFPSRATRITLSSRGKEVINLTGPNAVTHLRPYSSLYAIEFK